MIEKEQPGIVTPLCWIWEFLLLGLDFIFLNVGFLTKEHPAEKREDTSEPLLSRRPHGS